MSPRLYGEDALDEPAPPRRGRRWSEVILSFLVGLPLYLLRRILSLPGHAGPDPSRDELELRLLRRASAHDWPVFGICRGAQLINVYGKGSLHQRIDAYEEAPQWTIRPRKRVDLVAGTTISTALGVQHCYVNSLHRQAINGVARGFRVAAADRRGVIQGIERQDGRWFAVQWHPEYLPQKRLQRRLFDRIVALAREQAPRDAAEQP